MRTAVAAIGLASLVGLVFTLCIAGCRGSELPSRRFDAKLWKTTSPDVRGSMVRDLLGLPGDTPLRFMSTSVKLRSESPLFGLAREEIVRLLGPPDGGKDSPTYMSYRLGFMGEEGYLEEEWHLLFDFNKDGFPSRIFVGD